MYRQPELITCFCRALHKHVRHAKKGNLRKTTAAYSILIISPKVDFITAFNIQIRQENIFPFQCLVLFYMDVTFFHSQMVQLCLMMTLMNISIQVMLLPNLPISDNFLCESWCSSESCYSSAAQNTSLVTWQHELLAAICMIQVRIQRERATKMAPQEVSIDAAMTSVISELVGIFH